MAVDGSDNIIVAGGYGKSGPLKIYDGNGNLAAMLSNETARSGFVAQYTLTGELAWTARMIGCDGVKDAKVDSKDNVLLTAYCSSSEISVTDASGIVQRVLTRLGDGMVVVAKYSRSGNLVWMIHLDGIGRQRPEAIAIDSMDSVVIAGQHFSYPMRIYGITGVQVATFTNYGSWTSFVSKFRSDGSFDWIARLHTQPITSLVTDSTNAVIIGGSHLNTDENPLRVFDSTGVARTSLRNSGWNDGFIIKYTSAGDVVFAIHLEGDNHESVSALSVDSHDSIVAAGFFDSNTFRAFDVSNNTVVATLTSMGSGHAVFVLKYFSNGTFASVKCIDSGSTVGIRSVKFDQTDALIAVGIAYSSPLDVLNESGGTIAMLIYSGTVGYVFKFDPVGPARSRSHASILNTGAADVSNTVLPTDTPDNNFASRTVGDAKRAAGAQSILDILPPVYLVAIGSSIISAAIIITSYRIVKRKSREAVAITYATNNIGGPTEMVAITEIRETGHTTMASRADELSIPAFLELKWGIDFREEQFITRGGGGVIHQAKCLNGALTYVPTNIGLVVKHVAETETEMPDRLLKAFYQELSLMWLFREHPNFVKLYGYSKQPLTICTGTET